MKSLSVDDVMDLTPCKEYSQEVVEKLWGGNERLTLLEITFLDIPIKDIFWCVLHPEVIGEKRARLFACDFAERVLPIYEAKYPDDKRPRKAIAVSRKFANGEATINELSAAVTGVRAAADAAIIAHSLKRGG